MSVCFTFKERVLKRIKILHFIPLFDTGGTEKVVMDIHSGLDKQRYESHVCTFFAGEYDRFFAQHRHLRHILVPGGVHGPRWPTTKALNLFKRLNRLRCVILQTGVDVVHTHHLGPLLHVDLLNKLTRLRLPWVHTEHNVPDLAEGYARPVFHGFKPLRHPDYVTGVSPNVCTYLETRCTVHAGRIRLIANGVDTDRFALEESRGEIRGELGLATDDEVVGCIGNLRKEKNQRLAIEALALLHRQRPRLKLIVCGDGDYRPALERLAKSRGVAECTLFLGYRFDIPRILAAMDLFCLPSVYEGMPLSILEAWAANKPVVATDVIGIRDLVTDGITGRLVLANNPRAMADAIDALLADQTLRQTVADNGRHLATETYSLKAMVAQYAKLYENLIEW